MCQTIIVVYQTKTIVYQTKIAYSKKNRRVSVKGIVTYQKNCRVSIKDKSNTRINKCIEFRDK